MERKSYEMKSLLVVASALALLQGSIGCKKGPDGNIHIDLDVGKKNLLILFNQLVIDLIFNSSQLLRNKLIFNGNNETDRAESSVINIF